MPTVETPYNPEIVIHDFGGIGTTVPGTAPQLADRDTIEVGAPYYAGRVQRYSSLVDGGLFTSPSGQGMSVESFKYVGPGTNNVILSIVSNLYPPSAPIAVTYKCWESNWLSVQDNLGHSSNSVDPESFVFLFRRPMFLAPGEQLQVTTVGNLTAGARIEIRFTYGWGVRNVPIING